MRLGDDYPAELVEAKFMKLNSEHIAHVIKQCIELPPLRVLSSGHIQEKLVYGYIATEY